MDDWKECHRIENRMESNNESDAFILLGWAHHNDSYALPQNKEKAFDLWVKGSDLGSTEGLILFTPGLL